MTTVTFATEHSTGISHQHQKERKRKKDLRIRREKLNLLFANNKNIYLEKLTESIDRQLELIREFCHFNGHEDALPSSSSMENLLPLLLGVL